MSNKDIKKMIKESFSSETPNVLNEIKTKCDFVTQKEVIENKKESTTFNYFFKKFAFAMLACVLFIVGIFIGNIDDKKIILEAKTSIFLDVNPSLEIQVDENDIVVECVANNTDAEKILENVSLKGVEVNTALYAIVGSMYANGYITKEKNSILVSISNSDDETIVLENIVHQIENMFKNNEDMDCSIIGQEINSDEELINKAKQYNISIGKMRLIEKIINNCSLFEEKNIEELVDMSIHELNLLFRSNNIEKNENEYVSGEPGGFKNKDEMIDYICQLLNVTRESIERYEINTLYHHNNKFERELIYLVRIKFIDERREQRYIFNSVTGELLTDDVLDDWEDRFDDDFDFPFDDKEIKDKLGQLDKELKELYSKIHSSIFSKEEINDFREQYEELMDEYEDLLEEYKDFIKDKKH